MASAGPCILPPRLISPWEFWIQFCQCQEDTYLVEIVTSDKMYYLQEQLSVSVPTLHLSSNTIIAVHLKLQSSSRKNTTFRLGLQWFCNSYGMVQSSYVYSVNFCQCQYHRHIYLLNQHDHIYVLETADRGGAMVVYTLYAVYFCVMKPSSHTPVQYKRQRETVRDRERDSERQRERHRETGRES